MAMATQRVFVLIHAAAISSLLFFVSGLPTDLDSVATQVQPRQGASAISGVPHPLSGHALAPSLAALPQGGVSNLNPGSGTSGHVEMASGAGTDSEMSGDQAPASSDSGPSPNPFSNHFVLDTANLDLDSDGCIAGEPELDLFKYHVATALPSSPDNLLRAHSIVHRTDVNKDGRICWCDFISIYLHDKNQAMGGHRAAPFLVVLDKESGMFTRLDRNGDGLLQGAELEGLVQQLASCISQEQARLIVAAISGLGVKDGAVSSDEFARFLGVEPDQIAPEQATAHKPVIETQKTGIPGVVLTSTPPPLAPEAPGVPAAVPESNDTVNKVNASSSSGAP